jgi:hypothetical protein
MRNITGGKFLLHAYAQKSKNDMWFLYNETCYLLLNLSGAVISISSSLQ